MPEIKLEHVTKRWAKFYACLLYTSDAADD